MKLLKRLLFIKWHFIEHEIIELENINFLTGKNASGKSTIIDGLQLLILGDTTGHFFNKAANDNSTRTLKGYLRGEIADDGGSGFIYLREGTFTSYIAGEFYDTVKKSYFTIGIVFDSFNDGNHEHKFFIIDSALPKNEFLVKDVPMDYKSLRLYLNSNLKGKFNFFDSNRSYQDTLKGRMGSLNNKFFSLFKKSVPFSPIMDIEKFISEFVCDVPNKVDITDMQDNIRYYKRLEHEAAMVKDRISGLLNIEKRFEDYTVEEDRYLEQCFLIDRANSQRIVDSIMSLHLKLESNEKEIEGLCVLADVKNKELTDIEEEKDKLLRDKYNSDIYKEGERLRQEKQRLQKELERIENKKSDLERKITSYGRLWKQNVDMLEDSPVPLADRPAGPVIDGIKGGIESFLNTSRDNMDGISNEMLIGFKSNMSSYKDALNEVHFKNRDEYSKVLDKIKKLTPEIENLKKGIKPHDTKLVELKAEIEGRLKEKYGHRVDAFILCELIEIRDKEWQNAIEGYLHTQKFYLIVEPKYFTDALKIYDELKFKRNFYDIGLVDVEKLMKLNPSPDKGSLAEEIMTDNPYARAFINFLLGRVVKCGQAENLRNFRTSITPSCMLYQNFVARQLNPERWQIPYIGKSSIEKQIEIKEMERSSLMVDKEGLEKTVSLLEALKTIEPLTDSDIENIKDTISEIKPYEDIKGQYKKVIDEFGKLDLTYISTLDKRISGIDKKRVGLNGELNSLRTDKSNLEAENRVIKGDKLKSLTIEKQRSEDTIIQSYDPKWVIEIGEARFLKELENRKTPDNILNAFYSQRLRTESQRDKKWSSLVAMRSDYNRDYKMSYDINMKDNKPFGSELIQLRDTHLQQYEEKIKDAKEKAQSEFQEDFISKLKQNIDIVKEQIYELNTALKDVSFGKDKYNFEIKPNTSYRKYYDMITDSMLLEGFNLFSMEFQSKHRDAIDELFKQITDVGEGSINADDRVELERNIEKYTDYRTYLMFELIAVDEEGRESRLSKTIGKKSGGETQTPFYISVLASFVRLYRIKQKQGDNNTMRLIVFDEAFSKMDHQRIQESIKLLRSLELQAIVSAPTEKIGDIAPLVDRNLCVTRVKGRTLVRAFDPKEMMEE